MRFLTYQDAAGEWRWRLLAANNRIVAESGEGYETEHNVDRALQMIKQWMREVARSPVSSMNGRSAKRAPTVDEDARALGAILTALAVPRKTPRVSR